MQAHCLTETDEALSATETPTTLPEGHRYFTTGIRIDDQQWAVISNAHEAQSIPEQYAGSGDAHEVYGTMSFPSWTVDLYIPDHSPPYSTTELTNPYIDLALKDLSQEVPCLDRGDRSTTLQSSDRGLPSQRDQVKLEWDQEPQNMIDLTDAQDYPNKVGSVLENGKFMCDYDKCAGRTFARYPEFRRHYTTIHAARKPNFWCEVPQCRRSVGGRGNAFHRRDKLMEHVRSMHPEVVI